MNAPTAAQPAQASPAPPTQAPPELEVTSTPAGADISLDGNYVGSTPSTIQVPLGDHVISVKKTGFKVWERQMKMLGGKINIAADLEPEEKTAPQADAK